MKLTVLFAIFLGGSLGSLSRYVIWLGVEQAGISLWIAEIVATSIVNIFGAGFLGFVHSKSFTSNKTAKAFWGSGFAGGFTTMSGLALITAGAGFGLSQIGYLFWFAVIVQFILGILAYAAVRVRLDSKPESVI